MVSLHSLTNIIDGFVKSQKTPSPSMREGWGEVEASFRGDRN